MKAERRHELQTNALAKVVKRAPETWHRYGGRILLAVVAVTLVFVLVRYQITQSRENKRQAANSLALARQLIDQIRDALPGPGRATPQQVASTRRQSAKDAEDAIQAVVTLADDRALIAEALIARGDLNWTLATLPELPGAATQPTLRYERDPKDLLDLAAESYNAVVTQYSEQAASLIASNFGLAAIAENRSNWDEARKHYDIIEKNENLGAPTAPRRIRLASIDRWKNTPLIAPPATAPATQAVPSTSATTQAAVLTGPPGSVLSTQPTTLEIEATPTTVPAPATGPVPTTVEAASVPVPATATAPTIP